MNLPPLTFLAWLWLAGMSPLSMAATFEPPMWTSQKTVVIVGELHGTVEVPRLIAQLAQQAIGAGRRVKIAIEQSALSEKAISKCSKQNELEVANCLLDQPVWNLPASRRDGRSSESIAELLKFVSRIGDHARLGAFGLNPSSYEDAAKTAAMEVADSFDYLILLVGNYHSGAFGNNLRGSITDELRSALPGWNIVSVAPIFCGGTIWRYDPSGDSGSRTNQPAYIEGAANRVNLVDVASLRTMRTSFTAQQWSGIMSVKSNVVAMMGRSTASPPLSSQSPGKVAGW